MKKRETLIGLAIIILVYFFGINYSEIDNYVKDFVDDSEMFYVERIVDGDTFEVLDSLGEKQKVRMLGINTPEKGEEYSSEAAEFLSSKILGKEVELKYGKDKTDIYGRTLAYVFLDGENINLELVQNGLANFYFPSGRDFYYDEFENAWEDCINSNKNLCKKSGEVCGSCINLVDLDPKEEKIVFRNDCDFSCDLSGWSVKDEGRKNFIFEDFSVKGKEEFSFVVSENEDTDLEDNEIVWERTDYVWTDSGDTLFLRDSKGKLVLWETY